MLLLPETSDMAESNQSVPLIIQDTEGQILEAGAQRYGRHGLKQRLCLVAPRQVSKDNLSSNVAGTFTGHHADFAPCLRLKARTHHPQRTRIIVNQGTYWSHAE
jgi:hypothetical protein